MPICSNRRGREWLDRQPLPDDERGAINRHVRELDRLAEDLAVLEIAEPPSRTPTSNG
jgi:transposase